METKSQELEATKPAPLPATTPVPLASTEAIDEVPSLQAALVYEGDEPRPGAAPAPAAAAEAAPPAEQKPAPRRRGFATMDPAKVRELARRGAAASHARGVAHRFTSQEAREAGRKGGLAPHRARGGRDDGPEG